jgi:hypothetical protein
LEQRVIALEKGVLTDATQDAIRKREMEFLVTLREIREAMAKEGSSGASSAELDDIKKENEKLKATISKQEYRIRHLISGMEELMAAKKASA